MIDICIYSKLNFFYGLLSVMFRPLGRPPGVLDAEADN
jgi:hypothetical protein